MWVLQLQETGVVTRAGFNAQLGGRTERSIEELGTDIERVDEVRQQIVDVARVFFLGDIEVVGGRDGRVGDVGILVGLFVTVILHLRRRNRQALQNVQKTRWAGQSPT